MLAATNRPDVLDPALLRAGRFDRRVTVQAPDRKGRVEILKVHTRSIPLDDDVDLDALAASMPGMVGADIANLANEAALLGRPPRPREGEDGRPHRLAGEDHARRARAASCSQPADRERTAYHESGHALVGMLTPGADPVRKVSIIPRGMALGVTLSTPDSDRVSYSLEELQAQDQGLARRTRRRGGRLRQNHDGRRVRHPAADPDRAPDGRALGHERSDRTDHRAALRKPGTVPPRRQRDLPGDPAHGRRGGAHARRDCPPRGHAAARRAPRHSSRASRRRC